MAVKPGGCQTGRAGHAVGGCWRVLCSSPKIVAKDLTSRIQPAETETLTGNGREEEVEVLDTREQAAVGLAHQGAHGACRA